MNPGVGVKFRMAPIKRAAAAVRGSRIRGAEQSVSLWRVCSWIVIGAVVLHTTGWLRRDLRIDSAGLGVWGGDFHGGAWLAAKQILHGASPYIAPSPQLIARQTRAFVTPPAIGLLAIPLAPLPYGVAVALWNLVNAAAMVGGLWLLQIRDLRMYLLALFAAPFASSLGSGQLEGVFALLLAVAWRYRDSGRGGLAVGALIAAKLYAFPLVIWLVATKRFRSAGVAAGSALFLLAASWALIDFHGLARYPRLLNGVAHVAERSITSQSVVTLALRLGGSPGAGAALALGFGVAVMVLIVLAARRSDDGWFTATVLIGLVASPILWEHYLVLIFVPLAICCPRAILPWLLTALLWPFYPLSSSTIDIACTVILATAIPLLALMHAREQAAPSAVDHRRDFPFVL